MFATTRYLRALRVAYRRLSRGEAMTDGGGCPRCGSPVQIEGGCPSCVACPWSKCGGGRRA